MVEPPVTPVRRNRSRASRGTVLARRVVALVLLVAGLGAVVWVASAAIATDDKKDEKKAEPPATAPVKRLRIVFPEGFTIREMAAQIVAVKKIARVKRKTATRLSAKEFLKIASRSKIPAEYAGDQKRRILEGFLFPATYDFTPRTRSWKLVSDQLATFRREWAKVDLRYAKSKKLTPYDVLIIASMIEEEVIAPEERKLVSAVIYNRLKADMTLGIDATIRYGLNISPKKSLTKAQLRHPTPYNTRIHKGLPPTPITNPGLASMQAAARPAKVNYLYFVRKPDKVHHFFTASYEEFLEYLRRHGYRTD